MSTYKYVNGALEPIEPPEFTPELKWGPVGDPSARNGEDYAWYCGLPAEAFSAGLAEGFSISVYRATTDRAPNPYMAFVDLSDEGPDEIHFPELRDVIAYAREHAQLLQLTVLAGLAGGAGLPDLHDREAGAAQTRREPFGGGADIVVVVRVGGDRGDGQPLFQRLKESLGVVLDVVADFHER